MNNPLTRRQFRGMVQNMLDNKKSRFVIKLDAKEDWILVTTHSLSNVSVWLQPSHCFVDLALWHPSKDIVGTAVPPDAEDVSTEKTRQFRWRIHPIDLTSLPFEQEGVLEFVERAKWAFDWVRENRV